MNSQTIRFAYEIPASPQQVFELLMDSGMHAALTGMRAQIEPDVGGRFNTCNNHTRGIHLELSSGSRIVQAWTHKDFPPHEWTVVHFSMKPMAPINGRSGTWLEFRQEGVPEEWVAHLKKFWEEIYFLPMKKYWQRNA